MFLWSGSRIEWRTLNSTSPYGTLLNAHGLEKAQNIAYFFGMDVSLRMTHGILPPIQNPRTSRHYLHHRPKWN
jgi:hypothetical protein